MTVYRLITGLFQQIREWDPSSQISLIMALVLLIPTALTAFAGPENLRQPATLGTVGLLIVAQVIVMWGNRGMVTPFTKAQRHFLNGEFEQARDILEALIEQGETDVQTLTLLGNTHRQMGQLDASEAILYEARNKYPDHYFPWYGFGRTLLMKGHYEDAAYAIEKSLQLGAQPIVGFDAGEAWYRQDNHEKAIDHLKNAQSYAQSEPHRRLMTAYLLYTLHTDDPPSDDMIRKGLPYWQAQAALFAQTPYGKALAEDISAILRLRKEV